MLCSENARFCFSLSVAKRHLCWHFCSQITVRFRCQMTLTVFETFHFLLQCQVTFKLIKRHANGFFTEKTKSRKRSALLRRTHTQIVVKSILRQCFKLNADIMSPADTD